MVEQEELAYTTSSGWSSYTGGSDWSSDLSNTLSSRYMGIAGLEPIQSGYRNHEIIIDRQLGTLHGQAAIDFNNHRRNQRELRRTNRIIRRLTDENTSDVDTLNNFRQRRNELYDRIRAYNDFIDEGRTYSDDDIIN